MGTRISCRNARSSASKSINRLCIRISQWSHVGEPSPSGLFLQGTRSFFVGRGMGPDILTPVVSAICLTCWHIPSSCLWFVLDSFIRAFWSISPFLLVSSACALSTSALRLLPYPQQPSAPCHGLQTSLTVVSPLHAR